jgi:hypothetical protein
MRCIAALLRVKSPPQPLDEIELVMHADTYYFGTFESGPGDRSGSTESPAPGTKMDALVQLAQSMIGYVRGAASERAAIAKHLAESSAALASRFEREEPLKTLVK